MPRIVAYTYNAGIHCPACAAAAHEKGRFRDAPGLPPGTDEHGLPYAAADSEGNLVHPVFSTDEPPVEGWYCETCDAVIAKPDPEHAMHMAMDAPDPIAAMFRLIDTGVVDERDVGNFVAMYADGVWTNPNDGLCEGLAYIAFHGGRALVASWDNQGFWNVEEMTTEEAEAEIATREAESEGEEEDRC